MWTKVVLKVENSIYWLVSALCAIPPTTVESNPKYSPQTVGPVGVSVDPKHATIWTDLALHIKCHVHARICPLVIVIMPSNNANVIVILCRSGVAG